ncbi:MAG: SMC-Scp complex subunit ScpB [Chitinophagaceae bacterium]
MELLMLHIEALIFASENPLKEEDIQTCLNNELLNRKVTLEEIKESIKIIYEKYQQEYSPFEILHSGGGWQFVTKKQFHKTVAILNKDKFLRKLSAAALETLAIIAYKQPISRTEIEHIRGVSCEYTLQRLMEKELIIIAGRNNNLPGRPLLYETSKSFMDYFGINTPDDLPKISELITQNVQAIGNLSETELDFQTPSSTNSQELFINENLEKK